MNFLHLENRVHLKLITWLLRIGFGRSRAGLIGGIGSSQKNTIDNFLKQVEKICNTVIWGSKDFPVRWTCPYDAKEQNIGTISLDNERTRMVIDHLEKSLSRCAFQTRMNRLSGPWQSNSIAKACLSCAR